MSTGRVSRRELAAWLLRNGFVEKDGRHGHWHYAHPSGVKISIPGHGDKEMVPKTLGNVLRELERAGFDRRDVKRELGA